MEMRAFRVPHDLYVHIAGIDIVRTGENDFFVLRTMPARHRASPTCWKTGR